MEKIIRTAIIVWVTIMVTGCHPLTRSPAEIRRQDTNQTAPYAVHDGLESGGIADSATRHTLHLYPLWAGSTWEYQFRGYDQKGYVVWELIESVIETYIGHHGYFVAEVERNIRLVEGNPAHDFPSFPESGTLYYLVDGEHIYILESLADIDISKDQFTQGFPLPDGRGIWYPVRSNRAVVQPGLGVSHQVSDPYDRVLPIGKGIFTCYHSAVEQINHSEEAVFCETVGFVHRAFHYQDRLFGWWIELVAFSFQ